MFDCLIFFRRVILVAKNKEREQLQWVGARRRGKMADKVKEKKHFIYSIYLSFNKNAVSKLKLTGCEGEIKRETESNWIITN